MKPPANRTELLELCRETPIKSSAITIFSFVKCGHEHTTVGDAAYSSRFSAVE